MLWCSLMKNLRKNASSQIYVQNGIPIFWGRRNVSLGKPPSCFLLVTFEWFEPVPKKHIPQTLSKKKQCMSKKKLFWWMVAQTSDILSNENWFFLMALVVSTHLKNVHQWGTGNLLQIGVNMKNVWNYNLDHAMQDCNEVWSQDESWVQ